MLSQAECSSPNLSSFYGRLLPGSRQCTAVTSPNPSASGAALVRPFLWHRASVPLIRAIQKIVAARVLPAWASLCMRPIRMHKTWMADPPFRSPRMVDANGLVRRIAWKTMSRSYAGINLTVEATRRRSGFRLKRMDAESWNSALMWGTRVHAGRERVNPSWAKS
jgi:hypothetical protein